MEIQTDSLLIQNLCVPCGCRCRYCLLSWDGRPVGTDWERGTAFAERFLAWQREHRPTLRVQYAFGYSMEHPALREALRTLRRLGSPQAEFLQCDGMKLRDEAACRTLAELLAEEGVRRLNFTVYGLQDYHDRFAARAGDFDNLLRMMKAAEQAGLAVSCGIPLTLESAPQLPALTALLRERGNCRDLSLFVPHEEGRGRALAPIRMTDAALRRLPEDLQALLDPRIYRGEGAWIAGGFLPETKRSLLFSLRGDNIERCEAAEPGELLAELEALDDAYYAAFPPAGELAEGFGDPRGEKLYRQRDLLSRYRRQYAARFGIRVYDVTDERQSGSRRF